MKFVGYWICAASAVGLVACDQIKTPAAQRPSVAATSAESAGGGQAAAAPGAKSAASSPTVAAARARLADAKKAASATVSAAATVAAAPLELLPSGPPSVPDRYSADYKACMAAAAGLTVATANCYTAELARQGERLNRAYEAALAAISDTSKARLQLAQREWASLRDATCQKAAGKEQTDLLHEGYCRLDMTIERAAKLERMRG